MGQPAAKKGDQVMGLDTHIVMVPSAAGPIPTPLPHPFAGIVSDGLSSDVNIMGMPAATVDSTADNTPQHIATPPGTSFQAPPSNKATIKKGSPTVKINGKMAARNGDTAETCNDPSNLPVGTVMAVGTVMIG
jgi:uncharacterized Zn-binding protein involved in type VI secretion